MSGPQLVRAASNNVNFLISLVSCLVFVLPICPRHTTSTSKVSAEGTRGSQKMGAEISEQMVEQSGLPWLQLLHISLHDMASRDERLRK